MQLPNFSYFSIPVVSFELYFHFLKKYIRCKVNCHVSLMDQVPSKLENLLGIDDPWEYTIEDMKLCDFFFFLIASKVLDRPVVQFSLHNNVLPSTQTQTKVLKMPMMLLYRKV